VSAFGSVLHSPSFLLAAAAYELGKVFLAKLLSAHPTVLAIPWAPPFDRYGSCLPHITFWQRISMMFNSVLRILIPDPRGTRMFFGEIFLNILVLQFFLLIKLAPETIKSKKKVGFIFHPYFYVQ
jgi:hypothetical protein